MSRHNSEVYVFLKGISRARSLHSVFGYADKNFPAALDCSDILRSSIVLSISCLDLLVHSIVKKEILYRFSNGISINRLTVPYNLFVAQPTEVVTLLENHLVEANGYKSFVAPAKISEILGTFVSDPWHEISLEFGQNQADIKLKLKSIVDWRNRIAHEQDINPQLGGIELWPISPVDVADAIDFVEQLGVSIGTVIAKT